MVDSSPVFRPLLRSAWHITWSRPWLFLFGFAASFLGVGGLWELLFNSTSASITAAESLATIGAWLGNGDAVNMVRGFFRALREAPGTLLITTVLFLVIALVTLCIFWLGAIGNGALVDSTLKSTHHLKTTLRGEWAVGKRFAFSLLGIHLIVKIVLIGLFIVAGLFLEAAIHTRGILFLFAMAAFIVLVGGSLATTFLTLYAACYRVIRGFSIREALRASFTLFRSYWLVALELATLFFLISLVIGLITFLVLLILTIPFVFLIIMFQLLHIPGGINLVITFWLIIAAILFACATALFTTLQTVSWTLFFLQLTEGGAISKLVRLFQKNKEAKNQRIT
ncbi:MAG: hypothetical protein Q7S16_03400 [bacterium]|nr:hypothetical protein [bacterium]